MNNRVHDSEWYRLDNAAKIYPPVLSDDLTSVFRLSCTLTEPVRIGSLSEALRLTARRFPYFSTTLRRGFFWYYLEKRDIPPSLSGEESRMLTGFPVESVNRLLYRVLAHENRISVEFMHVLTDGGGAMEFFRSLLTTYLRLTGRDIGYTEGVIDPSSTPHPEETEDSFNRYYRPEIPKTSNIGKAWNLPFRVENNPVLTVTEAEVSVAQIKNAAAAENVSITEYLTAVYIYCLQDIFYESHNVTSGARHKVIRLEVPVNMRRLLPSRTMRNFALFVMPEIDLRLGRYTFGEIVRIVYHYMQTETDTRLIYKIISRNVKPEKNLFLRVMPLFIKDLALTFAYRKHGPTKYSSVLTNLGVVKMPEGSEEFIRSFSIIPPPPNRILRVSSGVISYGDTMRITFANLSRSSDFERKILRFLVDRGIDVKIINNRTKNG
jgi:NRPS condensation-like uncharacterized protein